MAYTQSLTAFTIVLSGSKSNFTGTK